MNPTAPMSSADAAEQMQRAVPVAAHERDAEEVEEARAGSARGRTASGRAGAAGG